MEPSLFLLCLALGIGHGSAAGQCPASDESLRPFYISQAVLPFPRPILPGSSVAQLTGIEAVPDGFLLKTSGPVRPDLRRLEDLPPRIVVDMEDAELSDTLASRNLDVNQLGASRLRVGQFQNNPAIVRAVIELLPENLDGTWEARYVPDLGGVMLRSVGKTTLAPAVEPKVVLQSAQLTDEGLVFTTAQPLHISTNWENPNEFRLVFSPAVLSGNFLGPTINASSPINHLNIAERNDHRVIALIQVLPGTRVGDLRPLDSSGTRILLPLKQFLSLGRSAAMETQALVPIVLDAGHGGKDPGAQRGGVAEKALTLGIIRRLNSRLRNLSFNPILTRSGDTYPTLADRVRITQDSQAKIFVSIHINCIDGNRSDINGIETYYSHPNSARLAYILHRNILAKTGATDRRVRIRRLYVTNQNTVPAVLLEVGYLSNPEERKKLRQSAYQDLIAEAITRGLLEYLK
jgi:N-acetylmuramoyl-L-alanine amidase